MCERNLEFISKLMSKCLRAGVPVDEVIEAAKSGRPCMSYCNRTRTKGDTSPGISCPSAIGKTLEDFKDKIAKMGYSRYEETDIEEVNINEEKPTEPITTLKPSLNAELCPECGAELQHENGCVICHNCGYSKCG